MSKHGPRPDIYSTYGHLGVPPVNTVPVRASKVTAHPISGTYGHTPQQVAHLESSAVRPHASEPGFNENRHEVLKFEG